MKKIEAIIRHFKLEEVKDAITQAGVLIGYRGVIIHDRLALYWKLRRAKHGLCRATCCAISPPSPKSPPRRRGRAGSPGCSWTSTRPATPPATLVTGRSPRPTTRLPGPLRRSRRRRAGRQPRPRPQTRQPATRLLQPRRRVPHPPSSDPALHDRPQRAPGGYSPAPSTTSCASPHSTPPPPDRTPSPRPPRNTAAAPTPTTHHQHHTPPGVFLHPAKARRPRRHTSEWGPGRTSHRW